MGRKGNWFFSLKKALNSFKSSKAKRKWQRKKKNPNPIILLSEEMGSFSYHEMPHSSLDVMDQMEFEQSKHAYSVAIATALTAEATVAAAHAAVTTVRLTNATCPLEISKENSAAIKIQAMFRRHMARQSLHMLRSFERLKGMLEGRPVRHQTTSALRTMSTLNRVLSQIHDRRITQSHKNHIFQQQKCYRILDKTKASECKGWDDGTQSKEEKESDILQRQKAALRRERALAYAYTHQQTWRNSKAKDLTFMDPTNPNWGWSWAERWAESGLSETRSSEVCINGSGRRGPARAASASPAKPLRPYSRQPNPPQSRQGLAAPKFSSTLQSTKSPHFTVTGRGDEEEDAVSGASARSESYWRRSTTVLIGDDDSLDSSQAVPGYMALTQSAKARSRANDPLAIVSRPGPDEVSLVSAKKRLSFSASPAGRGVHSKSEDLASEANYTNRQSQYIA